MNKEKKKAYLELSYNIVGTIIALVLMSFGILAWSNYNYFGYHYEELLFGADFYTEIYDVTQGARNSISEVGDAIIEVHNTIGAVVTLVSVLLTIYFLKKCIALAFDLAPEKNIAVANNAPYMNAANNMYPFPAAENSVPEAGNVYAPNAAAETSNVYTQNAAAETSNVYAPNAVAETSNVNTQNEAPAPAPQVPEQSPSELPENNN